jgi:hypothetical protein
MERREVLLIAPFVGVLVLGCTAAALAPIIKDSYEKHDPARMRAYRMSLLTDAQVLELHARAITDSAKQKQWADEQDKVFWRDRSRAIAECESNPATKLRDPNHCSPPIPFGMMSGGNQALVEPADDVFEGYVMGVCPMVKSVREARQHRCLP